MKTYLLDTHIFLWSLFSPEKLSREVREILEKNEDTIYVSPITFWEISLKHGLKKLDLPNTLPDELPGVCNDMGFEILPLSIDDVSSSYRLPKKDHRDPFDRMLIWQCIQHGMYLMSKDAKVQEYEELGLKWIS